MISKKYNETYPEYRDRLLDKLSPSFCGAKWYNATIWLGSAMTSSCHHPPAHSIKLEDVKKNYKAIHNTPEKKEDRRLMQLGQQPSGCEYCWKIESMGKDKISDRLIKSSSFQTEDLIRAKELSYDDDCYLRTLEITFDKTCQFACSYCNASFSTTWVKDIKTNGAYKLETKAGAQYGESPNWGQKYSFDETNPYIEAFFKWWEDDLYKTLDELRISGGEPLMSGHTWKLLDWFKENKNKSKTAFAINSNLGFDKDVIDRLIDSVDGIEFTLHTSNESMFSHAEYIRDGLKWDQWVENVLYLLESKNIKRVQIASTINALCLESLPEFLDLLMSWKKTYGGHRVGISLNILRFPSFQSPLVLSDDLKKIYKDKLEKWVETNIKDPLLEETEIGHITRVIDYLEKVKIPNIEYFNRDLEEKDFKRFYQQYDKRRNKDFTKTFSKELVNWYQSIET